MSRLEHVEVGTLARCAEGTLSEWEAHRVRAHLALCRSCTAAFVDAVRYRAAWLADPKAFELEGDDRSLAGVGSTPRRGRGIPPVVLARGLAFAAVAVLVVAFMVVRDRSREPSLVFRLDPAMLEATIASPGSGLVLPGASRDADARRVDRRSGAPASTLDLERELKAAIAEYEHGSRGAEPAARVVAGLLASGEIATADDYAREALRAHPDAVPLIIFAAEARMRSNDLPGAEGLLHRAAERAPGDPLVALDLGLVERQLGREAEARAALGRAARSSSAPIAARAKRELEAVR